MHRSPIRQRARCIERALLTAAAVGFLAAGCGDSADDTTADAATDTATTVPEGPATGTAPSGPATSADGNPTTATVTASLAVVPGWQSIADPIVTRIAETGGISFELDLDWMDANAGEDVEQRLVSAVASGELDAALVGVRALSSLGVAGFDVLVAPRLIDSYALQDAVMASDVPDQLLPRLDEIGVSGVAVVPGPMRYPIGINAPFVAPDDFDGANFHTFPADQNAATAAALGATHSTLWGGERDAAIDDGSIDVTENSMDWMRGNGRGSHLTVDPLWPAIGVFVVNPDLFADWSTTQVDSIASAIASGSSSADDFVAADTELAAELCANGKQIVTSSAEELEAMLEELQPVYDVLTADPFTNDLLEQVTAMRDTVTPAKPSVPENCSGAIEETTATGSDDPSVLNGSYQLEWTVAELVDVTGIDEPTARKNDGVFTLTLDDGTFDMVWENSPDDPCGGTYGVTGDRVQFVSSSDLADWTCGGESLGTTIIDAAWRLDGDQLVFTDFVLSDQPDITWWNAGFFSKPLTRVEG